MVYYILYAIVIFVSDIVLHCTHFTATGTNILELGRCVPLILYESWPFSTRSFHINPEEFIVSTNYTQKYVEATKRFFG